MPHQDILDHQNDTPPQKRPTPITVVCIIGFIGSTLSIPFIFSDLAQEIGSWYPPLLAFASAVGLSCMVGLWKMKKWAAYTYGGFFALNQVILLYMGLWQPSSVIFPIMIIAMLIGHLKDMD